MPLIQMLHGSSLFVIQIWDWASCFQLSHSLFSQLMIVFVRLFRFQIYTWLYANWQIGVFKNINACRGPLTSSKHTAFFYNIFFFIKKVNWMNSKCSYARIHESNRHSIASFTCSLKYDENHENDGARNHYSLEDESEKKKKSAAATTFDNKNDSIALTHKKNSLSKMVFIANQE